MKNQSNGHAELHQIVGQYVNCYAYLRYSSQFGSFCRLRQPRDKSGHILKF